MDNLDEGFGGRHNLGQSSLTVTVAEPKPMLAKALQDRGKELPEGFCFKKVRETIKIEAAEYKNARSESNAKLRTVLGDLYDEFIYLSAHQQEQDDFLRECAREGVWMGVRTDLSVVLVRFHLGRSKAATTNRYASVLREAALQGIAPGDLAKTLGENRGGVKAMARQFAKRSVVSEDNVNEER